MDYRLIWAWKVWDIFYQHITRIEYVDKKNGNIFRVVFCRYYGPKLTTPDGVEINNGNLIVKLHICNWKLSKALKGIDDGTKMAFLTLKLAKNSLPGLAEYIENHPKGKSTIAIIGTTFLHRGVKKLGFDVGSMPNKNRYKLKNIYLKFMLVCIHPDGLKRLKIRPEELIMKRVYISKNQLLNRYGVRQKMEELE
ncbi:MAG: hypothetical protein AB7V16_11915 [Vulcanibacillus sp.]